MKNRIKEVLKEKSITQKELAAMVGMSEVGISNAINGSASKGTIEKVAEALDISVNELIDTDIPYAKYGSEKTPLRFGTVEIPCYVLNDGRRVFSGRGLQKAIGFKSQSGQWMRSFCNQTGIAPYLNAGENSVSERLSAPIKFSRNNAGGSQSETYGYEATLLIDICSAIIDAERAGDFNNEEMIINADIIIRSVAKVGIIALIDEATGYNKEKSRAKDELQKYLHSFLSQEASRWIKVFDDVFFEDLYKMHNWTWNDTSKRPGIVGKWINDIVYERIGPRILAELREKNPSVNGRRAYKHHQFLTSDVGLPRLKEYLSSVHTLAIISRHNWHVFMKHLDVAYPRQYQQLDLFNDLFID